MTDSPPSLTVGVVLYRNEPAELRRLLASLDQARTVAGTPAFRVEFLDNSCDVESSRRLRALLPSVEVSPENLGFGRAHNRLMRAAFRRPETRWYLCLNPDAIVHPDMIAELLRQVERMPRPGLVEAAQFPSEHPKAYDPASHATDWCSGCALLITRSLYEAIGGFDEQIFLYCEDVDLSWRARAAGFDIAIAPRALVHHFTGDRPPGGRTRIEMVRAGAYLAAKFGAPAFGKECAAEYEALTGLPLAVPGVAAPTDAMRRVADFTKSFHFAQARW